MANFKLLSKFIDAIDNHVNECFCFNSDFIFRTHQYKLSSNIEIFIDFSCYRFCTMNRNSLELSLSSFNTRYFNYTKLKDDIKSMDDIELIMIYGRELLDDILVQRINEHYGLDFTLEDYLESKPIRN